VPGKFQSVLEMYVGTINKFCSETIGHHGKAFAPYIGMIGLLLGILNTMGIFGVKPPTRDFSVTAAMAIMTMLVVIFASLRYKGIVGFVKSLFKPAWFMFPMNLLEYLIRPLSLSMRLFGNVFGALVMMELVLGAMPYVVPAFLSIYLDIFDGILQAYVFMFLTTLYIAEAVE
jgi:F-type H+-transporting ATPase subunit a